MYMPVSFQIQHCFTISSRGEFVLARMLEPGKEFYVPRRSFLGGVELEKFMEIPRILDKNGRQRYDLFAFQLKNARDRSFLTIDSIVDLFPGDALSYLKPWYATEVELSHQLQKELKPGHVLYGKQVRTLARRQDNDDVLFEVDDAAFRFAVVHLTWSQKPCSGIGYPRTETFQSWQEVYEYRIAEDHDGWENE